MHMSAQERKRKSAKERKRAQKDAKECKRVLPHKNYKPPGLKQGGLGTPKSSMNVVGFSMDRDFLLGE